MDMNVNWNVKLMQVSSKVAEKASSDGTTNKQCRPAHRLSTETTVTEAYTNFANKLKPTLSQRPVVTAEETGTDGIRIIQCRSKDYDKYEDDHYADSPWTILKYRNRRCRGGSGN